MARKLAITANTSTFSAYPGEILLDAALQQGICMPHDCRAGQCGSCIVRVKCGQLFGGETGQSGVFHACQARVFSDARVDYDQLPSVTTIAGTLVRIDRLAPDIRGLTIKLKSPARHRPGQYYRFKFQGFPARCFSPSPPFVGKDDRRTLRLHVKMVRDGEVSSRLETGIQAGHKVRIEGPFGSAFFRPGEGRRLILVASGTGFAPIWAIAKASLRRQPNVPLLLIAGSRKLSSLYMAPALCRLAVYPSADFVATTDEPQSASEIVRRGTPDQYLPEICSSDLVYAAGSPRVVDAVCSAASCVGAAFYADPFVATSDPWESWFGRQLVTVHVRDLKQRLRAWFSSAQWTGEPMNVQSDGLHDGLGVSPVQTETRDQCVDRDRFWRRIV
jgi:3-phenylpropionate/trans-cinnamate dioxygenase ferredoxin reductase subunit